ncbi:MAG TPA: glycosyltransferase family 39 protein [Acidothermaceae bacterium]
MPNAVVLDVRRPAFALKPVAAITGAVVVVLLATSNIYGYHRDELYFRVLGHHLGWGYIDQPPLTPLLGRISTAVFGDHLWALRLPSVLAIAATAVLLALIARELGGTAVAQSLAALGVATNFALVNGHLLLTTSVDAVIWVSVILCILRALIRQRDEWWLVAGLVTGIGLYNKHLIVLLLLTVGVGLFIVGPRRVFASRTLWLGVLIALVVGAPNLIYQATNGWPQFDMASALEAHKGHDARFQFVPFQIILLGPPLVPIWIAGFVSLWRRTATRAVAVAYPLMSGLLLVIGGQPYYTEGLVLALYAAGVVATCRWMGERGGRRGRRLWVVAGVGLNIAVSAVISLPLLPVSALAKTPIPGINQTVRDQIGWPVYVRQVAAVYTSLPASDRTVAVVIAGNYGELGAMVKYGRADGLPAQIYSGQNALYYLARPPTSATVAVVVGIDNDQFVTSQFANCVERGKLNDGVDIDNEEQGRLIRVCRDPVLPWPQLWPRFRHLD